MTTLAEIIRDLPGVALYGTGSYEVTGIELDSRRVRPGQLFAALAGRHADGRAFVAQAVRRGACAVLSAPPRPEGCAGDTAWLAADAPRQALALLARRFHGAPDGRTRIVGITGTDGKTTTAAMTSAALDAAGWRSATGGTLGQTFGTLKRPQPLTTPEAPELWSFIAEAARLGAHAVVLEVSSAALSAERVYGMRLAGAVLTGISPEHLDLHGTMEQYRRTKRRLFEMLPADGFAIVPDDPGLDEFSRAAPGRVVRFGSSPAADWRIEDHRPSLSGARFWLVGPGFREEIVSVRPGPWDARNLAAAVATAVALGADPSVAAAGAAELAQVPGRWELVDAGQPFPAVVDYAHTPQALARVLALLRQVTEGRVIVVFGCGGERDTVKRAEMGRIAAASADLVLVTDDNPRSEDPEAIAAAVIAGAAGGSAEVERVDDRARAICRAVALARPEDALLVAGKGHERYQEIGGERLPFDDREALRAAIRVAVGER